MRLTHPPCAMPYPEMQSALYGNFSAPKAQEIVVSRGCTLELLRPDDVGKLQVGPRWCPALAIIFHSPQGFHRLPRRDDS